MQDSSNNKLGLASIFRGCFAIVLVFFGFGAVGAYYAYTKANSPIDLGVSYSKNDFNNMVDKLNVEIDAKTEDLCFNCAVVYEGKQNVSVKLDEAQISSWIDLVNEKSGMVKGTQMKFEEDKVSVSTTFNFEGQELLIFISGSVVRKGFKSINVDITELKVGSLPMPKGLITKVDEEITEFANKKLSEIDGLRIETIDIKEGYILFEGDLPEKIRGYE